MILKIPHNIIRFFLALGIAFIGNNFLTPIVLSETLEEEKKEQLLDSSEKIIEQLKLKANELEDSSDWANAETLRIKILSLTKQRYGLDHPDTATAINNLGELYQSFGQYEKAESLYKESLEIRKKVFGKDNREVAISFTNLGILYLYLGKLKKAETYLEQSLEIIKDVYGLDHRDTATTIENLAVLYLELGKVKKAEPLYKQSLEIRKKLFGLEHRDTAISLNNIANFFLKIGEPKKAETYFEQSLEIYKRINGLDHPDTALAISNLGFMYDYLGKYKKAEPLYKQSLEIRKKLFGQGHPEVASSLNHLGDLYHSLGKYKKAEPFYKQSLEIRKKVYGLEHFDTASSLNNIAYLHYDLGELTKAEKFFEQSLGIIKKIYGLEHYKTATAINNLGEVYYSFGQFEKAESLYKDSLEIREKVFGQDHPDIAISLEDLGSLFLSLSQYEKAKSYLEKSLEIRKKVFGLDHPDTATSLNDLALAYESLGNYEDADNLYRQSLEIRKKLFGLEDRATAISLNNVGLRYMRLGQYEKAKSYLEKSVENFVGLDHPNSRIVLDNLGYLYSLTGEYEKRNEILRSSLITGLNFIHREMPFLPLSSRIKFADYYDFNDYIYNDIEKNINSKKLATFGIINTKGLLEEIEKKQSQLEFLKGPHEDILNKLRIIDKKIANLKNNQNKINHLLIDKDKLEKKLYRLLPVLDQKIVNIEDLTEVMPNNSILVEYVKYFPHINEEWKSPHYLALVLDPSKKEFNDKGNLSEYKIHAIDLGLAETLENIIQNALNAIEEGLSDTEKLLRDIGEIIIQPIADVTKESKTWFISPDGELNKVPFAALRGYEGNNLLVDQVKIRLLTTGRELIDLQKKNKSRSNISYVFANPLFDSDRKRISDTKQIKSSFEFNAQQNRSIDLGTFKWSSLPGTAKEGKFIANIINARLFLKDRATAKKIINIKGPEILHIASHSFYLKNQENNIKPSKNQLSTQNSLPLNYFAKNENPLLRSGVVLAGANNPDLNQEDDGYLTALEIAQLDWRGTELVVISGCESGLGEVKNGDGIYGLKRAISVAGAKSSLLSLWKVDDQATAVFMKSFYERLIAGEGRAEALINTQREFRNHKNKNYRYPYIWASFQLSGDWRPIDF